MFGCHTVTIIFAHQQCHATKSHHDNWPATGGREASIPLVAASGRPAGSDPARSHCARYGNIKKAPSYSSASFPSKGSCAKSCTPYTNSNIGSSQRRCWLYRKPRRPTLCVCSKKSITLLYMVIDRRLCQRTCYCGSVCVCRLCLWFTGKGICVALIRNNITYLM